MKVIKGILLLILGTCGLRADDLLKTDANALEAAAKEEADKAKEEADKAAAEKAKAEADKAEADRLAAQAEKAKADAEQAEADKLAAKAEADKVKADKAKAEAKKIEDAKLAAAKAEEAKKHEAAAPKIDTAKIEAQKAELAKQEAAKVEAVRLEAAKNAEVVKAQEALLESSKEEQAKLEAKRLEEIKAEALKKEKLKQELKPKSAEQLEEEKKEGETLLSLDTLGAEDEGNWLLKRVWWEQAESTFEKIITLNNQILEPQMEYFNSRKTTDKAIDNLFRKIGYEHGELDEMISYFLNDVLSEREKVGDLTVSERDFIALLNEKKADLEQLKLDIAALAELETKIDEALMQVVLQVNKCRDYEKSSWNDFKEIGRVLNDKKAKALFYQIEGNYKNIQNIVNYIKVDLKKYFEGLLNKASELSDTIISKIDLLEKEGINIKDDFAKIKRYEEQRELEAEMKKKRAEEIKPKAKPTGWFSSITNWFKSFF